MTKIVKLIQAASLTAALLLGTASAFAQEQQGGDRQGRGGGRGNFDPAQMQQRMMERYKEQLEITDDAEWKVIQDRVQKVVEARNAARGNAFGMFGGGRRGQGGGPGGQGGPGGGPGAGGGAGGRAGASNPDGEALQKAIEGKASADELKVKLAKYRDSQKAAEAKLEKAQEDLRKVLNTRQEAIAVLAGILR